MNTNSSGESARDDLTTAAQITVVFLTAYSVTFVNVLITKQRLRQQARRSSKKKSFDRYTSPQMHNADRLQLNFLEWSPAFLGLLWSLAATGNLSSSSMTTAAAWAYVGLRFLYIVLLLRFGVDSSGMNVGLWISTFPAYFCLVVMFQQAVRTLFF